MFNALESFRDGRGVDGWRLQEVIKEVKALELFDHSRETAQADYPVRTRVTNELILHVGALQRLFNGTQPRVLPI